MTRIMHAAGQHPAQDPQAVEAPTASAHEACATRVVCSSQVVRPPVPGQHRDTPASVWELASRLGR